MNLRTKAPGGACGTARVAGLQRGLQQDAGEGDTVQASGRRGYLRIAIAPAANVERK
jgi:hypothetical protein